MGSWLRLHWEVIYGLILAAVCQGTCCREIIPLCRCSIFLRVRTQARTCTYYARRPWPPLVSWRTKGTGELSDCVHIWCHGPQIDLNTYSVLQRGLSHASRPTTGFTSDRCIENIGGATGYMMGLALPSTKFPPFLLQQKGLDVVVQFL